jgi:hypothetical protein
VDELEAKRRRALDGQSLGQAAAAVAHRQHEAAALAPQVDSKIEPSVAYPGVGDACPDFECAAGLSCDDNICSTVVEPIFELGSSCENTCNPFFTGLFCDDGTCAAIEVVDVGETCVPGTATPLWCINQFSVNTCADSDGDGTSTCEARPTVSESCAASFNCDPTATCVNDQCEARGAEGESCEQVECLDGLQCNADTICEAFQDDSAVCPA